MKRFGCILSIFLLLANIGNGQEKEDSLQTATEKDSINTLPDSSITVSDVGDETTISIKDKNKKPGKVDTTYIKIGKKAITIIEDEEGTNIKVKEIDGAKEEKPEYFLHQEEEDEEENHHFEKKKRKNFEGHWSGFSMGLNNFMDRDYSMNLPQNADFMELHTGKSWNVNLNIIQYDFGIIRDHVGLVTGLGFEFNDYKFDGNNNIRKDSLDNIVSKAYYTDDDKRVQLDKTKLSTVYLTVPAILEFQVPTSDKDHKIHLSGGIIGGLKIGSNTKIVYYEEGKKEKRKKKDDFNLSPIRYGFTARVGYRFLNLYANYYPTPLFEAGTSPEIYPFAVGLTLIPFN